MASVSDTFTFYFHRLPLTSSQYHVQVIRRTIRKDRELVS